MTRPTARQGNRCIPGVEGVKKVTHPGSETLFEVVGTIWQKELRVKAKGHEVCPVNGTVSERLPHRPCLVEDPAVGAGIGGNPP